VTQQKCGKPGRKGLDLQVCLSHEETKPDLIGEFPSIVTSFVPGVVFGRFLDSFVLPFF
jgi:hypothetical protein